jgi:hypothetical protein
MFRHLASAVGGYFLLPGRPMETVAKAAVSPIGKAKFCVFVYMAGGPSHTDTFDLKEGPWLPAAMNATRYDGMLFPQGIFPKMAEQIDQIALLRSVRSWVAVHELGREWIQIGRNPLASLSRIAPHIGSVVSLELGESSRSKILPGFVNLNNASGPSSGYLHPQHAPFYVTPGGAGLANTRNPDGQPAFERRFALMQDLDAELRASSQLNPAGEEIEQFNTSARKLMYNSDVDRVFTFDQNERNRYGNTAFGNSCITARNLIRADMGTRFIQLNVGSWDNHTNIYQGPFNATNVNSLARQFDSALGQLIADLRADGLLDQTLIFCMGEFGRTVGPLNAGAGRDHFVTQAVMFAGGGIRGKRAIGVTDSVGRDILEPETSLDRPARAEDIEATIYSALGINWLTIRRDDPLNRGFEYVPQANDGVYKPIHELWS